MIHVHGDNGRNASFGAPELREQVAPLREVDNRTNLGYIALEYACLAAVIAGTVAFDQWRGSRGLAWAWDIPVFAIAILLVGGIQHRLAGLGHEASHYTLLGNKWWNDLVGDVLCLFPILGTVHFYRLFHMAHHQYTNDPHLDPDLVNLGPGKGVAEFPMSRSRFIITRFFSPLVAAGSFVRYTWEYTYVNVLGKGNNVYMRRVPDGDASRACPRVGTMLGLAYLVGFAAAEAVLIRTGRVDWLLPAGVAGMGLALGVTARLPGRIFFRSPFRQPYSARFSGVVRLGFYMALLVALGRLHVVTGGKSTAYALLLWLVPLATTFPYFMRLRDTYQHTNADDGRLTNTRVFFCDPFTRWAVFVYGQDMHVPHHLFPAIPHYRLRRLHQLLKGLHPDYAAEVVECHGTFRNDLGLPTILDVMAPAPGGGRKEDMRSVGAGAAEGPC